MSILRSRSTAEDGLAHCRVKMQSNPPDARKRAPPENRVWSTYVFIYFVMFVINKSLCRLYFLNIPEATSRSPLRSELRLTNGAYRLPSTCSGQCGQNLIRHIRLINHLAFDFQSAPSVCKTLHWLISLLKIYCTQ
jgi:hypothetical protein